MAFTAITNLQRNYRARTWKCTGDGVATVLTVPADGGRLGRTRDTATTTATATATAFDYSAGKGGLLVPKTGTAQAVTSTVVNSDGTLTVTFTVAPGNGVVVNGVTVYDQDRADI
jgi:hypothetical protein